MDKEIKINLLKDVFFTEDYVGLYLKKSDEIFKFKYQKDGKIFFNIAIKKPIELLDGKYFDLETAYGYGGYYTNTYDNNFIEEAFKNYKEFCIENNIIAEFIRFHPFNANTPLFRKHLEFLELNRKVVYVDLKFIKYSPTLKRNIKKAESFELIFLELNKKLEYINDFINTYYLTMDKNKAKSFYYFSEEYFRKLFSLSFVKLFGVEYKGIMTNFIVCLESNNKIAYYHLGATKPEFYKLNVTPFIFDRVILYYKNRKYYNIFYLGGGNTLNDQDSLFKFKAKFSSLNKNFDIGGNIFNENIFNYLKREYKSKSNLFLFWRSYDE